MKYPPGDPHEIAKTLKKDCGIKGGIEYADWIANGADSPQYRTAYRKAKRILIQKPDSV
jgi:hypothetical protein